MMPSALRNSVSLLGSYPGDYRWLLTQATFRCSSDCRCRKLITWESLKFGVMVGKCVLQNWYGLKCTAMELLVPLFFFCLRVIPMHLRLILFRSFQNEVKAIKAKGDSKDVSVLLAPQKGTSKLQSNFTWTLCSTGGYCRFSLCRWKRIKVSCIEHMGEILCENLPQSHANWLVKQMGMWSGGRAGMMVSRSLYPKCPNFFTLVNYWHSSRCTGRLCRWLRMTSATVSADPFISIQIANRKK